MRSIEGLVRRATDAARRASRLALALAAGAALVALPASPAGAQTATANLRGYVRGADGNALGDVQVSARNIDNNATRGAVTNAAGFYYMGGLRPGRYEVTARRIGLQQQVRAVVLPIGTTTDENFTLQETTVQLGRVEVVATAGATARTSEVGTNISREQIENLPNVERNFLDIARLAPGITAKAVNDDQKFLAAGGQPAEAVNVFIDGATYKNDVLKGGVVGQDASKGNPFPQGAVQEFRIITQNYKAEYQKASSAIITATTRSGGNRLEGELFAQGIGKAYVARDPISVERGRPRPNYSRLQAGGNIGGPLVRDRLFFFGTYELNFRDEPRYVFLGDFADSLPAALRTELSRYEGEFTTEFRQHLGFGKLTWNQSDRSTFDLSTTIRHETDFRDFGGQRAFTVSENLLVNVYNGVGNWRFAANNWLNEAQVNVQHFVWNPKPSNESVVGRDYDRVLRVGGRDTRQTFTQNRYSIRDDITRSGIRLAGDHVFKGGASIDFLTYEAEKFFNGNPVFRYRNAEDFARPFEANFGFGDPTIDADNAQIGFYLQDDWTPTRKLVLNLGLRWDVETNMINNDYVTPQPVVDSLTALYTSAPGAFNVAQPVDTNPGPTGDNCCVFVQRRPIDELGGLGNFLTSGRSDRPAYKNAWQPRLGAAYDLFGNGRTVIFGGFGIYYDRNYWNTLLDERFRRQYKVLTARFNDTGPTTACPECVAWDPRYFDPAQLRAIGGSTGNPEVFLIKNDMKPPQTTQSSFGLRQGVGSYNLTVSYNGIRGKNGMNFVRASPWGGPGPNFNTVFIADDRVRTWYDALQLQVERPMLVGMRWGGQLAYTLSRSEEQGQSTDIFWGFDDRYTTVADRPRLRAPGDQRHAVVANAIYRMPWDFRLSGIVTLGSGITVNGNDETQAGGIYRRTYVFTPPSRAFLGVGHVFNQQSLDLRLDKSFVVRSGQRVALIADLFNALNSRNFGCYNTALPAGDRYGLPDCAAPGRRFQLGLRYGFQGNDNSVNRTQTGGR